MNPELRAQDGLPIIIDTDAGTDDFMAIAYLLSQPRLPIEAITVVHGLAHVRQGANNIRRLLQLAGREDIPVFEGEERPLRGSRTFPAAWRLMTDKLVDVQLPELSGRISRGDAVQFMKRRLSERQKPVRILALGPLTNLALALRDIQDRSACKQIVIMGGAVEAPGNLAGGNPEKAANDVAEWNIYVDPHAADQVFKTGIDTILVSLDATNQVPINRNFVEEFAGHQLTVLGRVVADVLNAALPLIETDTYFAWDPLAAVAMLHPTLVGLRGASLEVLTEGANIGKTRLVEWNERSRLKVAVDADGPAFKSLFEQAFLR